MQMPSLPGFMGFPGLPSTMPNLSNMQMPNLPGFPGLGGLPGFPDGMSGMGGVNQPGPLDPAAASFFANLLPSMPSMSSMSSASYADSGLQQSSEDRFSQAMQMSSAQGASPMLGQSGGKRSAPEMMEFDRSKRARTNDAMKTEGPVSKNDPPSAAALAAVAAASAAAFAGGSKSNLGGLLNYPSSNKAPTNSNITSNSNQAFSLTAASPPLVEEISE
jgi:hypothetical protein